MKFCTIEMDHSKLMCYKETVGFETIYMYMVRRNTKLLSRSIQVLTKC